MRELKSSGAGEHYHDQRKKLHFEERVEIGTVFIAHDRNYAQTAEQYQVSYPTGSQLYSQI